MDLQFLGAIQNNVCNACLYCLTDCTNNSAIIPAGDIFLPVCDHDCRQVIELIERDDKPKETFVFSYCFLRGRDEAQRLEKVVVQVLV